MNEQDVTRDTLEWLTRCVGIVEGDVTELTQDADVARARLVAAEARIVRLEAQVRELLQRVKDLDDEVDTKAEKGVVQSLDEAFCSHADQAEHHPDSPEEQETEARLRRAEAAR